MGEISASSINFFTARLELQMEKFSRRRLDFRATACYPTVLTQTNLQNVTNTTSLRLEDPLNIGFGNP